MIGVRRLPIGYERITKAYYSFLRGEINRGLFKGTEVFSETCKCHGYTEYFMKGTY